MFLKLTIIAFPYRLKAFTSVAVLGMSVAFGLESPSQRTLVIVLCISAGVALASYGEIDLCVDNVQGRAASLRQSMSPFAEP